LTQTLGSPARVRWDKPKDKLNPERTDKDVHRIIVLVVEVRRLWEQAVDGGVYPPSTETNGRGKGFADVNPTETAARSLTQVQLRGSAKYAAVLINEAAAKLEDASRVLHNGLLRTDPEVLEEFLEKRRAATQE
jgi:hypothetical protein